MGWRERTTLAQRSWVRLFNERATEQVVVNLEGESPTTVQAIFDSEFVQLDADAENSVADQLTRVDLIEADLPRAPEQYREGDSVFVPRTGTTWRVTHVERDSQGMLSLILTKGAGN